MKGLHGIAFVLVVIGGLNWGLIGLGSFMGSDWNVVSLLVGSWSMQVENLVYVLVGLSAVVLVFTHKQDCKACGTSVPSAGM